MVNGAVRGVNFGNSVTDPTEVFHNRNERPISIELCVSVPKRQDAVPTAVTFEYQRAAPTNFRLNQLLLNRQDQFNVGEPTEVQQDGQTALKRTGKRVDLAPYLVAMDRLRRMFYVGAFRNVLNTGAKQDYFDIQVGDAFIKRWRGMQTGNTRRENRACEEVVAAIERLFGYQRLHIQAADSNDTLHLTIDRKPYKLYEQGAGLAQFILVLANAAAVRPSYVLIDEPELNLHPSLQLDFLTALGEFAEHGLLFSTHNIGLARSAADRVYSVIRREQSVSQVVQFDDTPNLPEFLGELSYSSYQAVGFNQVLLVEGPTEVRAIQQFLRKLRKDRQVLLIPLSGASGINAKRAHELNELKRITPNMFALIDSERTAENAALSPDRQGFTDICRRLGIDCCVLERRAIENYLTENAIRQVKGVKYRQLGPYEDRDSVSPMWGKPENWRIAGEMSWDDVKNTNLGRFLEHL